MRLLGFAAPFLFFLLLSLPFSAGEDYCVVDNGGGTYQCYNKSTSNMIFSQTFCNYCTSLSGICYQNLDVPPSECINGCCCNGAVAAVPTPISQSACNGRIGATPPTATKFYTTIDSDCNFFCSSQAGAGTFTITGSVTNTSGMAVQGATVRFSTREVQTNATGGYTLPVVPQGQVTLTVTKRGCVPNSTTFTLNAITIKDFTLDCTLGECIPDGVNDTVATPKPGTPNITVTWSERPCDNHRGYYVQRCIDNDCVARGFVPVGGPGGVASFLDVDAPTLWPANTKICYNLSLLRTDGTIVPQVNNKSNCVLPMSPYCTAGNRQQNTCFYADTNLQPVDASGDVISPFTGVAKCDLLNRVSLTHTCAANEFCASTTPPYCRALTVCDACNGPYGWFVDAEAKPMSPPAGPCENLPFCYLRNKGYLSDTYGPCSEVKSCYDYPDNGSCTTPRCGVTNCEWLPFFAELGSGLCVGGTDCDACSRRLGAECNATTCLLFGDCYYAGATCLGRDAITCASYASEADCINATGPKRSVSINVTYNTSSDRVAGNHLLLARSNDLLRIGHCTWIPGVSGSGGRCVKNSDGHLFTNSTGGIIGDDCEEQQHRDPSFNTNTCFGDTTPPATSLPFGEDAILSAATFTQGANPVVTDNVHPASSLKSRFCINLTTTPPCYPDREYNQLQPGGFGQYRIGYYSFDPAGNLEVVRHINVTIVEATSVYLEQAVLLS